MAKKRKNKRTKATQQLRISTPKSPFLEHVQELRQRLVWIALSVVSLSVVGYFIQEQLVDILLRPAHNQQFIYTSPGGGINFLLQVCIYFGIALSTPVIIYSTLRFVEPLFRHASRGFIVKATFFSAFLAVSGMSFGYFVGLPAAMHFLSHQFNTNRIEALLSVGDYLSFVTVYLAGSAIMFQLPLLLILINRITPLKPGALLKGQRWVVVLAFVAAAVITPTPDLINQSIIAGPIIVAYQVGVIIVWWQNKRSKYHEIRALTTHDQEIRNARQVKALDAVPVPAASLAFQQTVSPTLAGIFAQSVPANMPKAAPIIAKVLQPFIEITHYPSAAATVPVAILKPVAEEVHEAVENLAAATEVVEVEVPKILSHIIPGRRVDRVFDDAAIMQLAQPYEEPETVETVMRTANKPPTSRFETA